MNKDLYYIYRYTSPKGQSYIGLTNNLDRRELQHKSDVNSAVYPLINKYGEDLEKVILFTAFGVVNAKEVEQEFIDQYDSYYNGYNRTLGGDAILHSRVLTEEQVLEIVEHLKEGTMTYKDIGNIYNVGEVCIRYISNGRNWTTVTGGKVNKEKCYSKGSGHYNSKLTESMVIEIKTRLNNLDELDNIASDFNITKSAVKQIYAGHNWKGVGPEIKKRPKRKLTQEQIDKVTLLFNQGKGNKEIIEITGLSGSSVKKIKREMKKGE